MTSGLTGRLARRAVMLLAVELVSVAANGGSLADARTPRGLFVCQYGTAKSAIAREVFRKRARDRGIAVTATSRGITPAEHVSSALRTRLKADGIDSARDGVQRLTADDLKAADIIVTFNPLPEEMGRVRAVDWSALPSMNENYFAARADLIRRVDALLNVIARRRGR